MQTFAGQLWAYLSGASFVYSPLYLISTALIAYVIWRVRGGRTGFLAYLLPRRLYAHPSTMIDLKITILTILLTAAGPLTSLFVAPSVAYAFLVLLLEMTGQSIASETGWARGVLVALMLFVTQDFCQYITHYFHHRMAALWPFHAVHHSAEVLTPLTYTRSHPVYYAIQMLIMSALIGLVQAIALFLLVGHIEAWVLYASAMAFNAYMFLGGHLRHSHIRLSYGRVLEHILISPAQHQIHHSSDKKHFDKNFGEVFAFWDWMFGTLYIPDGEEELVYGISDADGRKIDAPYPTLRAALLAPFAESYHALRGAQPTATPEAASDVSAPPQSRRG